MTFSSHRIARSVKHLITGALTSVLLFSAFIPAAASEGLDWHIWEELPTYDDGRIKPINTMARELAETICGRVSPTLSPPAKVAAGQWGALFPDNKPRQFRPSELMFSWIVEPERWEEVPFLPASHERLREELLDVPVFDAQGNRLTFVTPRQVARSQAFQAYIDDLRRRRDEIEASGRDFRPVGMDRKVHELWVAYRTFRLVSYSPQRDPGASMAFFSTLREALGVWQQIEPQLQQLSQAGLFGDDSETVATISETFAELRQMVGGSTSLEEYDATLVRLKQAAHALNEAMARYHENVLKREVPDGMDEDQAQRARSMIQVLATRSHNLALQTQSLHLFLYESGTFTPHVVPALYEVCLIVDSDSGQPMQPWLSLPGLLYGSEELLKGYPQEKVREAREAFATAAAAYRDRDAPVRAETFAHALSQFREALREIATAVEPLRRELELPESSRKVLAETAYPPPGYTLREVHYYRLDPFKWSWILNLLALTMLVLSIGRARRFLFWPGLIVLAGAQAMTIYGFTLRVMITGWAPVTNMFESVVFVSLVMGLLALGFVLYPMVGGGLKSAWRMTGIPGTWETTWMRSSQLGGRSAPGASASPYQPSASSSAGADSEYHAPTFAFARWMPWVNLLPRAGLTALAIYLLGVRPYGEAANRTVFDLVPEGFGATATVSSPAAGVVATNLLGWLVGILIMAFTAWYLPRAILAAPLGLITVPLELRRRGMTKAVDEALARKPFATAGAALAFLVAVIAYFTPVWDSSIQPLQPILRDRMWLFAHVLTITAGYGGALLAWGLGNAALAYYLFGRYRKQSPKHTVAASTEGHRPALGYAPTAKTVVRPPEPCGQLSHYIYRTVKVTVILLAAGTILGGVWADRSWGRFWGWDPKEVWALIAILVFMVIMHGRYARWINNFGLAAGSVFGMIAVVWAWYGVNFLMGPGLHSYAGEGGGGGEYVVGFFTLNLLFVGAAFWRYAAAMKGNRATPPGGSGRSGDSAEATSGDETGEMAREIRHDATVST